MYDDELYEVISLIYVTNPMKTNTTFFLQKRTRTPRTMAARMPERTRRKMMSPSLAAQSIFENLSFLQ